MNKSSYIALTTIFGLVFIILSCDKDESKPTSPCVEVESNFSQDTSFFIYDKGSQEHGYATGIKNNKEWTASGQAKIVGDKVLLWFITYLIPNSSIDAEYLEFSEIPMESGCYPVFSDCNNIDDSESCVEALFMALDDDVIEDYYIVHEDTPLNNILEIEDIDLDGNIIKGKLSVSFVVDDQMPNRSYNPLYIRLFNTQFECRITQ